MEEHSEHSGMRLKSKSKTVTVGELFAVSYGRSGSSK